MLSLDTGLWSGFQRQMELAESFAQPIITVRSICTNQPGHPSVSWRLLGPVLTAQMMRRGGILSGSPDTQVLIPNAYDSGQILETKWQAWAQRESFKRYSTVHCPGLNRTIVDSIIKALAPFTHA
jgi:hypothetical protein